MSKIERVECVAKQIMMLSGEFKYMEVNLDEDGGYVEIDGIQFKVDINGDITTTISL